MTNAEKYKTAKKRAETFEKFCKRDYDDINCNSCKFHPCKTRVECAFAWLDREVEEEKLMPCPFCGGDCQTIGNNNCWWITCDKCNYTSSDFKSEAKAIASHNRVAKAVAESEAA